MPNPHKKVIRGGIIQANDSWIIIETIKGKETIIEKFRTKMAAKFWMIKHRKDFFGELEIREKHINLKTIKDLIIRR